MTAKAKRRTAVIIMMASLLVMIAIFYAFVYRPWADKRNYPLYYPDEIQAACAEFDLDPYMIAALIRRESSFRPEIISHAGAVGLMQVMPDTGEWISGHLGIADYDPAMLTDPAVNTRLGCWYIRFLLDRYDGLVVEALTAYNQGHGTVDGWLADESISLDGKTLQKEENGMTLTGLPANIKDGKVYASLILQASGEYERIYPDAFLQEGTP